ncbi:MAG: hypothetical protein J5J00_17325 [Deltaproteobacteria bacterium]|nr:hypothetical protein [Deltaproteobacteria bacterium]
MFAIDTDLPITNADIAKEFANGPIPIVSVQPLSEQALSIYRLLDWSGIKLESWQAEQWVRERLYTIAEQQADKSIREKFLVREISQRELLGVLEYADSEQLLGFSKDLILLSGTQPEIERLLRDKFDNILYFANDCEKHELITFLLESPDIRNRFDLAADVLRSSENLEELTWLTEQIGADRILASGHENLKECYAQAVFKGFAASLTLPAPLPKDATVEQCKVYTQQLTEVLEEIMEYCLSHELAGSKAAMDLLRTAASDIADLRFEESLYQDSPAALTERLNINRTMLQIELMYGVNVSYGSNDFLDVFGLFRTSTVARWSAKDVEEIADVLAAIPEKHLLFSPNLREIQRVTSLGPGVLGARYGNGTIKIADLTISHQGMMRAYQGVSSLKIVLAHEIGHGIQIGAGRSGIDYDNGPSFEAGEERYDFDEYLVLSGWTVIERDRYEISEDGEFIILDGEPYKPEEPIVHDGRNMVLVFHPEQDLLFAYDSDAKFSYRPYSRTSPWEDFAEAFAEYLYLPERLIEMAPEKFLHLELEFRRYHNDEKIKRLLDAALQKAREPQLTLNAPPPSLLAVVNAKDIDWVM